MTAGDTFGAAKEVERVTTIEAQMADFCTQMSSMTKAVMSLQLTPQPQAVTAMKCGVCQGGHYTDQCLSLQGAPVEDVNYIGNRQSFNQGISMGIRKIRGLNKQIEIKLVLATLQEINGGAIPNLWDLRRIHLVMIKLHKSTPL